MNAANFLDALVPMWRDALPPTVDRRYFESYVRRNRAQLEQTIAGFLDRLAAAKKPPTEAPDIDAPTDLQTPAKRTRANLAAMKLVAAKRPGEFTEADIKVLLGYSGFGGLSIDAVRGEFPPGLVPESFGLIHEYYTPTALADAVAAAVCGLLPELAGLDGVVRALEPSAGIGRLVRAFTPRRCLALQADGRVKALKWTTVEFSKVSSRILMSVRPDAEHHHMPLERWAREYGSRDQGTFNLVVSNPPYGERGSYAHEDPDGFYNEPRAYAYFMRRTLDMLVPGGLGVFLVPAGCLSGPGNRGLREKLLRRHHLSAAFRLPSHDAKGRTFIPGAFVVMDVHFWRSRGGELTAVDPADEFILEGRYFDEHPEHVLGESVGPAHDADEAGKKPRGVRAYEVVGDFTGLPPLVERPTCTACVIGPLAPRVVPAYRSVVQSADILPEDTADELRIAVALGARVARFLAARAADDLEKTAQLWPELHAALTEFTASKALAEYGGNPWGWPALQQFASRGIGGAQQFLNAFHKTGRLVPELAVEPKFEPRYTGDPDDIVAQAEHLFRQRRSLTERTLMLFHARVGGSLTPEAARDALLAAGWNQDGDAWDELYPSDAYLAGTELWARHDRAAARAKTGDAQAAAQVRRLLAAIKPAVFEDISDISPQHGYVPLDLVAGWLSDTLNSKFDPLRLERADGFVQAYGRDYTDLKHDTRALSATTVQCLGWLNHDFALFKPERERRGRGEGPTTRDEKAAQRRSLADERDKLAQSWNQSFRDWLQVDDDRRAKFVDAYNRANRGRIIPTYPPEPLHIARWGAGSPTLKPHQVAGARRILAARGGLLAFDVGVGKTYTAIAVLARARQEGWVRRPVILVPSSLVWKWHDDILCTLPDYRVLVIGSNRRRLLRGKRKDAVTSEPDTPQERAAKWVQFQGGQVDVVILSYDALARTRMSEKDVVEYIEEVEAVSRSIALRRRNLGEREEKDLSERDAALLHHGVAAWVTETLKLPKGHEYDPGIVWNELGIDMLIVDEAAAFKNLYMPQAREDGVPKFMGSAGEGSHRAWQLDFRAAAVRKHTGGAGIVLLTATPAKNSPLEFYNIIQFIEPSAFTRAGIHDPEQFIDRFLRIERRDVLDASFNVTQRSAVVGFKNLDDLRTIIFTYGEFRTAEEVGLKLPKPVPQIVRVPMDEAQEAKYSRYVAEIEDLLENPNPSGSGNRILGLLARLSLVALHAQLDEGYTYQNALTGGTLARTIPADLVSEAAAHGWTRRTEPDEDGFVVVEKKQPAPNYHAPKFSECARRIAASPHCGHIIFCEPTATHQWIREVLVEHGIPRDRIAILNAIVATGADRVRIAREFNGLSSEVPAPGTCARPTDTSVAPLYDVVIANSVAYEGIDLQVRTCTIHHIDLPWTPSDLEQRNGRAVRQGNTLGTVGIFYYFADQSTDGYRFGLIDGKATWLADLLKSQKRDTNNPAAQQELTPEDILLMISRDKAKTERLIAEKKEKAAEEARARVAREAARLLKQASGRFRDARTTQDAERAAKLRAEGEERLADLTRVSKDAWPWAPWIYAARDTEFIVPELGPPVWEGLRIARPRQGSSEELEHLEFGRILVTLEGERVGLRASGSATWQLTTGGDALQLQADHYPREGGPTWPADDDARTEAALDRKISDVFRHGGRFADLRWRGASDVFIDRWWPRFGPPIAEGIARAYHEETVPVVAGGKLALRSGASVREGVLLAPSRAGWREYLALAPASGIPFTELKEAGEFWWERKIPQDLLSAAKAQPVPSAVTEGTQAAAKYPPTAVELSTSVAQPAVNDSPRSSASTTIESPPTPSHEPSPVPDPAPPPQQASEPLPTSAAPKPTSRDPHDEVRSLVLAPEDTGKFLARIDKAIASGKPTRAILVAAREKSAQFVADRASGARGVSWTRSVIDAFERRPGYRLDVVARGQDGHVLAVYPEGGEVEDAVASIDLDAGMIDDVRWLSDRLTIAAQDDIVARVEQALEAAERIAKGVEFSPIEGLIAMMERRGLALGADPDRTRSTNPHGFIARALAELSEPIASAPTELIAWLEDNDFAAAADLVDKFRSGDGPGEVGILARKLWVAAVAALPIGQVAKQGDAWRVPCGCLDEKNGQARVFARRLLPSGEYFLHTINVEVQTRDGIRDRCVVTDPSETLVPDDSLYTLERDPAVFIELHTRLGHFITEIERTPKRLEDVRRLLYWTAAMIDTPRCQKSQRAAVLRAFESATHYYKAARLQLARGNPVLAFQRVHDALRRLSSAAASLAEACAEGQAPMVTPTLEPSAEDRAVLEATVKADPEVHP